MNFLSYLRVETSRIFRAKSTWLAILLTVLSPLAGYFLYQPAMTTTKAASLIANPALAGTIGGSVLFAIMVLFDLDRVHRTNTDVLTDMVIAPAVMNLCRILAVMAAGIVACVLAAAVHLMYPLIKMGSIFNPELYFAVYASIMLLGILLAILAAAAFYQVSYRVDLSFVLFVAFILLSMGGKLRSDFVLRWINPVVPVLSDDFGNYRILLIIGYNRLFWFLVLGGVCLLSMLCVRRYGKGLMGSLIGNVRKIYIICPAILLIAAGCYLHQKQPFFDNSPLEVVYPTEEEIADEVILLESMAVTSPNIIKGDYHGVITYQLENRSGNQQKIIMKMNPGYKIYQMTANGKAIPWLDSEKADLNEKQTTFSVPSDKSIKLIVEFGGFPQEWSILQGSVGSIEIGKNYINLTNQDFSPSLNTRYPDDRRPSMTADVTLPEDMVPVSIRGSIKLIKENQDGTKTWQLKDEGVYMPLIPRPLW